MINHTLNELTEAIRFISQRNRWADTMLYPRFAHDVALYFHADGRDARRIISHMLRFNLIRLARLQGRRVIHIIPQLFTIEDYDIYR